MKQETKIEILSFIRNCAYFGVGFALVKALIYSGWLS